MKSLILILMTFIAEKTLKVKSSVFTNNEPIPAMYTCEGDNINPPLTVDDIPENARSLALIMDDPDAPKGTFVHWVMWNIPVERNIVENSAPGVQGANGRKQNKYTGPCPPSGTHHYHFKFYALDAKLNLKEGSDKSDLLSEMDGHILASGELIGLYQKK